MRLILMGTGPFAVPSFEQLYETRHEIAALVAAPVRLHRGQAVEPPSRLRRIAAEHGTPIFDPEDINTPEAQERLRAYRADLMVVCDYGQILRPATLATARLGEINLHGSLLPKYRGAAPINWAIYHGESASGVTVIHMTAAIDAGPLIARAETPIGAEETAVELEARLAALGAGVVRESIEALEAGRAESLPQDPTLASKAPRLKKTDGAIDWSRSAVAIKNQVRPLEPWPRTYTFWHRGHGPPVRLILGPVRAIETIEEMAPLEGPTGEIQLAVFENVKRVLNRELFGQPPGTVLVAAGGLLVIAAGRGAVAPKTIQPAGKRMMSIEEFLRGHPVEPLVVAKAATTYEKLTQGFRVQPGERFGAE